MYFITTKRMLEVCFSAHPNIQYRTQKKDRHFRGGPNNYPVLSSYCISYCVSYDGLKAASAIQPFLSSFPQAPHPQRSHRQNHHRNHLQNLPDNQE